MERLTTGNEKGKWIPVKERLPETDDYILLSFDNFSQLDIGRYETDEDGGAFYPGDVTGVMYHMVCL